MKTKKNPLYLMILLRNIGASFISKVLSFGGVKAKKIPLYLMILLLTIGASLILGLLSLGGMFALWPVLSIALIAFVLCVAYEGEIYFQNIKNAFAKLLNPNYLSNKQATDFLVAHFPENVDMPECPQFFRDYVARLRDIQQFEHKNLDHAGMVAKKKLEKELRRMERWFAKQLYSTTESRPIQKTSYDEEIWLWLTANQQAEALATLKKTQNYYRLAAVFSLLAAAFMTLATSYLLVEAFAVIPFLALIPISGPAMIVPMAIVAGIGYGLLTYNSVTDMINNDTIRKWYHTIKGEFAGGRVSLRAVVIAAMAITLVTLAVILTVCTAGTWWTIAKHAQPLFHWMRHMPSFIMGIINPIVVGISALFFNVENTSHTMEILHNSLGGAEHAHDCATDMHSSASHAHEHEHHKHHHHHDHTPNVFSRIWSNISTGAQSLWERENIWQILNPFRLLLKVTLTPLRMLLFFGHLISIGVTGDRVPGIPKWISAVFGIVSEGFEDYDYFFGHDHAHHHAHSHDPKAMLAARFSAEHGHDHSKDIPTYILMVLFSPVFALAALWDFGLSQLNSGTRKTYSFDFKGLKNAMLKQLSMPEVPEEQSIAVIETAVSEDWVIHHAVHILEKHCSDSYGLTSSTDKQNILLDVRAELRLCTKPADALKVIDNAIDDKYLNQHRFFGMEDTRSVAKLKEMRNLVSPAA